MKNLVTVVIFLCTLLFSTSVFAADDGWVYAGRFGLLRNPPIAHNVDMYLVNHLTTYRGAVSYNDPEGQMPYDVYYMHDHSTDTGDNQHEYNNKSFQFQVKIVPLSITGKKMGSGVWAGTIVCSYTIASKGAYGVVMKSFKVFDNETHQQLFTAAGNFESEQLYQGSAAEAILKESSPHPVYRGEASQLNGIGYYKYK